jgi:hypothetical protein
MPLVLEMLLRSLAVNLHEISIKNLADTLI